MILLDALYINNSGGKVLLDQLMNALHRSGSAVFYLLDSRVEGDYPYLEKDSVVYMGASLKNRKQFYLKDKDLYTKVICFGNIPPPVKLNAVVYTYFHQLLYLEPPKDTPFVKSILSALKSRYIQFVKKNTNYWIVQTSYGKSLLSKKYSVKKEYILEYPFYSVPKVFAGIESKSEKEFLYVSDGNPHKNHHNLLLAWRKVNAIHPDWVLHLTVSSKYPKVIHQIEQLNLEGLNIINHGILNRESLAQLYARCTFFVFPSLTESLGLPLVEACYSHCKILSANLDYCKAVVTATDTFDPQSPEDIAKVIIENGSNWRGKPDSVSKFITRLML